MFAKCITSTDCIFIQLVIFTKLSLSIHHIKIHIKSGEDRFNIFQILYTYYIYVCIPTHNIRFWYNNRNAICECIFYCVADVCYTFTPIYIMLGTHSIVQKRWKQVKMDEKRVCVCRCTRKRKCNKIPDLKANLVALDWWKLNRFLFIDCKTNTFVSTP